MEDKDRASLAVVERIFTGLRVLGCLAPENDAVVRSGEKVKKSGFEKVVVNWQKQFQNSVLDSDNCSKTAC